MNRKSTVAMNLENCLQESLYYIENECDTTYFHEWGPVDRGPFDKGRFVWGPFDGDPFNKDLLGVLLSGPRCRGPFVWGRVYESSILID